MGRGTTRLVVEIRRKAFGDHLVLRDLDFIVEAGETLAVLGPSGSGKSTLLRIVAGLDRDFEGRIGAPAEIAMVFQEPTLLPWRTALQNLTLTTGVDAGRAASMLAEVGLAGREERFPRQLSLGQQRRLALARAMVTRPRLLLLDEPFVSLDAPLVEEMLHLTERLIAEVRPASLFVTHAPAEARRLATRTLRLDQPHALE
ncbi:MAG: ABC transporter ATP-binding protein [Geminicoccaceae bacterium]|nr:ABC transporter ATP-binding protein [Geminicoccaceae bacterium]